MPNVLISELDASGTLASGDLFLVQHAAGPPADYCTATQIEEYVNRTALATGFTLASGGGIRSAGNFTLGAGANMGVATTVGYIMITSCTGTPTGVPVGFGAGNMPIQYDTSANKLWVYAASGAWRGVALT